MFPRLGGRVTLRGLVWINGPMPNGRERPREPREGAATRHLRVEKAASLLGFFGRLKQFSKVISETQRSRRLAARLWKRSDAGRAGLRWALALGRGGVGVRMG